VADKILSQEEIDALLSEAGEKEKDLPAPEQTPEEDLSAEERDALGEIGNITLGSAATTLSLLLGQRVNITSPRVIICPPEELKELFAFSGMVVKVEFTDGLKGHNILVLKREDALVLADLMMGGDGKITIEEDRELTEMEISAAAEIMNQMIGTAATSLAELFGFPVKISPPAIDFFQASALPGIFPQEKVVVAVFFRLMVGELLDSEFMQILEVGMAREEAALLLKKYGPEKTREVLPAGQPMEIPAKKEKAVLVAEGDAKEKGEGRTGEEAKSAGRFKKEAGGPLPFESAKTSLIEKEIGIDLEKIKLFLDIPLQVKVVLGRAKKTVKEVLSLGPGAILEMDALVDEPVEILVNDTLVAKGEVVVVDENFGVRIVSIISPAERMQYLTGGEG